LQRAYGLEVPQNLKEACDPRRLALIVYDMQVGILRQIQGGDAVTAKVAEVLRVARAWASFSFAWRWPGSESAAWMT
jgi:biuret amidohydrolase